MSQTAETTKSSKSSMSKGKESIEAKPKESWRDTLESLAVAGILALLIHCFLVEAFVIPTGSMATTLMGRHKEIVCPECGETFTLNAYEEVGPGSHRIAWGICDNCRFPAPASDQPSFKGDRILVMKFPFDLPSLPGAGGPNRWDVIVFKYPNDPERQNYIKRMVGMPNEDLRVLQGDIQTRPGGTDQPFTIRRKPLFHQKAMQFLVYDDSLRPKSLLSDPHLRLYRPEWNRWLGSSKAWSEPTAGNFAVKGSTDWSELRYRHVTPDLRQWRAIREARPLPGKPRPSLITDFNSYNTSQTQFVAERMPEPHWVGDLTLESHLELQSSEGGEVRYRLMKGGIEYDCVIDLSNGDATLFRAGKPLGAKASTALKGTGAHDVTFANVDGRLTLWVDGATPFGEGVVHDEGTAPRLAPTAEDLAPARIGVRGPVALTVGGLVLKRDIYYTQDPRDSDYGNLLTWNPLEEDKEDAEDPKVDNEKRGIARETAQLEKRDAGLKTFFGDPKRFAEMIPREPTVYPIGTDRFVMMGDNSPRSSDSRAWSNDQKDWDVVGRQSWEVPRIALIGKAFFVYWPHGEPFGPKIPISPDFVVPFRPYFERMKLIK